jgi:hypothetical protein
MGMSSNLTPGPFFRELVTGQDPDFDLLPRILSEQRFGGGQHLGGLRLEVVNPLLAVLLSIAVDQNQIQIHHGIASDDLLDTFPPQGLVHVAHQRFLADSNLRAGLSHSHHHGFDQRLQDVLILAEVLWDDEDVQEALSG